MSQWLHLCLHIIYVMLYKYVQNTALYINIFVTINSIFILLFDIKDIYFPVDYYSTCGEL